MHPPINWNFKAINPSDYQVTIDMITTNKIMKIVFEKALAKFKRRGSMPDIESFTIPKHHFQAVHTSIRPVMADITKKVKKDGIKVLSHTVASGSFKKDGEQWLVNIIVEGMYHQKC